MEVKYSLVRHFKRPAHYSWILHLICLIRLWAINVTDSLQCFASGAGSLALPFHYFITKSREGRDLSVYIKDFQMLWLTDDC